jgi:hypothetical protein
MRFDLFCFVRHVLRTGELKVSRVGVRGERGDRTCYYYFIGPLRERQGGMGVGGMGSNNANISCSTHSGIDELSVIFSTNFHRTFDHSLRL